MTAFPTPPFFNQGHEKPIHFFRTAVTRQKSNPHALTCRLDDGVLSLSTKEKQNKKENACTGIASHRVGKIRFKEKRGKPKIGYMMKQLAR